MPFHPPPSSHHPSQQKSFYPRPHPLPKPDDSALIRSPSLSPQKQWARDGEEASAVQAMSRCLPNPTNMNRVMIKISSRIPCALGEQSNKKRRRRRSGRLCWLTLRWQAVGMGRRRLPCQCGHERISLSGKRAYLPRSLYDSWQYGMKSALSV